jgi:hypothetical protein
MVDDMEYGDLSDRADIAGLLAERVKEWRTTLPADIEHAAVPKNGKPQ